ncbi:MAG: Rrf2 family transcriptional regulator [Vicinamibacterales bacterium]
MTINKATYYALCAAMQMARAPDRRTTVGEVAALYGLPDTALAKVFQQLVRAKLARGARGIGGGYTLARSPAAITVLEVISALEPDRALHLTLPPVASGRAPADVPDGPLRRLFDEVDVLLRSTFASVSLETLVGRRRRVL